MSFASGPADRFQGPPPSSDRYAYSNAYAGDVAQHPRPAPLRPAAQQQQYYDGYGQDAGYAQRPPLSAPPQAQGHEHYGGEFQGPPAHVTGQYGVRPAASHAYGTQPHPHQYAYSTPPSASSAYSQPVHPHQPPPIAPSASAPVVAQYTHDPYAPPPPMLPPQQQQPPRADMYYQRPPPQQHLPPPDQYYSQGEQGYYRHDPAHSPVPPQPQYPAQQPQYPAQQPQYPAQQPQYPAQRPPYSAGPGYGPPDPNPPHSRPTTFYGQQPPAVSGPVSSGPMRQPPVQHQIPPPLHNRPPQLSQSPPPPVLAHAPTMPPPHSRQSPRHNQSPMLPPGPAHAPTMPPPHHNQSPPPRNPALRHPPMRHSPVYQQRNSPQPQPLSQSQAQLQRHGSLNSHPGLAGSRPAMGSFGAPRNSPTPVTLAADPGYSSSAQVPGGLRRGASLYEQQRDMLVQQPQHMAALVGSMGALSLARSSPQPPNPAFSQPALAGSAQMPAPYRMQGGLAASAAALGTQARADVTGSTLSLAATENSACPMWTNISADAFSAYQHQVAVQQSNLSGTKYALIVGINYYELEYSQTSNINGAHAFKALLMRRYGYAERNIVLLSDDQEDARSQPTHHNISTHVKRMMREVRPNDAVFFYFCGFGRLPAQLRERRSDVLSGIRRL
ncbi:Ca(2+)-dependent cysteine protease, partial [Coemansia sp. RSA 2704]